MNRCINARDAMAEGGSLVIEMSAATFDEKYRAAQPFARPGSYAMLPIRARGTDAATLDRIFEPFFHHQGNGQGHRTGASHRLRHRAAARRLLARLQRAEYWHNLPRLSSGGAVGGTGGGGTDELRSQRFGNDSGRRRSRGAARTGARDAFNLGYDAILACDGEQAIHKFQEHGDRMDLLLDVVLPKIDGPEACARMSAERPDAPVVFATGYSPDIGPASQSPGTGTGGATKVLCAARRSQIMSCRDARQAGDRGMGLRSFCPLVCFSFAKTGPTRAFIGHEPPIAVDTVSLRVVMRVALVDSGGNAGLPERQAHHTQASIAALLQHPTHPGRWMLPGIRLPF
jgi:CheY-like chemotaxis protein